ncbi:hypothetical protein GIX45_04050 [Erwinia sp. CPCC 100877]|nr:hypothetical protein [Erwinia sp. CPCC 100877]
MNILSAIFTSRERRIGTLVPTVVMQEVLTHDMTIASHPIERGASISDHAFASPVKVKMDCGFGGGGSLLDFASDWQVRVGLSPAETLDRLVALQKSAVPITIITGKRTYENMLIQSLQATTDGSAENTLKCSLTLQQVILVDSQQIAVAPKKRMTEGVATSGVQNAGVKGVVPVKGDVRASVPTGGAK